MVWNRSRGPSGRPLSQGSLHLGNSAPCLLSWCPPEKMAGDVKCGDPAGISLLMTDTTSERFCGCRLAADGLCPEEFLVQCARARGDQPLNCYTEQRCAFPAAGNPGTSLTLEQAKSLRTGGPCRGHGADWRLEACGHLCITAAEHPRPSRAGARPLRPSSPHRLAS